jgi:hypothetical protein
MGPPHAALGLRLARMDAGADASPRARLRSVIRFIRLGADAIGKGGSSRAARWGRPQPILNISVSVCLRGDAEFERRVEPPGHWQTDRGINIGHGGGASGSGAAAGHSIHASECDRSCIHGQWGLASNLQAPRFGPLRAKGRHESGQRCEEPWTWMHY